MQPPKDHNNSPKDNDNDNNKLSFAEKRKMVSEINFVTPQIKNTAAAPQAQAMTTSKAQLPALAENKLPMITSRTRWREFAGEHYQVLNQIKADNAEVIILALGVSNNLEQNIPQFAKDLANSGKKVSIYTFDTHALKNAPKHPNIELHINDFMFPPHVFREFKPEVDELVGAYATTLANKAFNKNFKAIFLDCCWSELNPCIATIAQELARDGFSTDHNLAIVHSYFDHSPACSYLDPFVLPTAGHKNPILAPEERLHSEYMGLDLKELAPDQRAIVYDPVLRANIAPRLQYLSAASLFQSQPSFKPSRS